jgi:hypothetical protein
MRDGSRSSSTEYEFDAGAEMSPVGQEEEERSASQPHEERVFLPQESPVRQEERGGSQDEEGLFVPEGGGVDMAAALAWEEDEEDGGDRVWDEEIYWWEKWVRRSLQDLGAETEIS